MGIWNQRYEAISRDELQQVQLERLQASVNRAYENVAFYKRVFDELDICPEDIKTLDDLARLPFTTRENLADGYPYDMFAVSLRDVVRIHSSSGVAGTPAVCGYTAQDLRNWSELAARVLTAGGVDKDDVIQVHFGLGLFSAGFGFQSGAERIGASVVPISADNPENQIAIMRDYKITALVGTASYALSIADQMAEANLSSKAFSLRTGVIGGEPWSEDVRSDIESRLGIKANDYYGVSELAAPGIAWECEHRCGLHIAEDHFIAEVVDPKTGERLDPGQEGELVLTTLTREALPLIRYRTRDLTSINLESCACGRTLVRMARVHARSDDMFIIQGIRVFPSQVEAILAEIEGTKPHYRIVIDRSGATDDVEIQVEVSDSIFGDTVSQLVQMEEKIVSRIRTKLGISPRVRLVEPKTLSSAAGHGRRVVFDRREL